MKKLIIVLSLFLAVASGCTSKSFIKNVNVDEVQKLIDEKTTIIDVRTAGEYQEGYLPGAVNIDWNQNNFMTKIKNYDANQPIVLYCRSGNRSGAAANKLHQIGFTKIYSLTGGLNAWQEAGKQVSK